MSILYFLKPQYRHHGVKKQAPRQETKKKEKPILIPEIVLPPSVIHDMTLSDLAMARRKYEVAVLHMMSEGYL